ncbi:Gfo/Idh/MocA family oxidoreductase [Herbiconiux sp. CPCC 205763]|uniref:Gfo/Idh/MocA family oxidoreductase n=1 Tax=Herbiconiux aconitum TaxID=2970913 RepID=A0ABT2GV99_9MICO|nr:Gfo/Idh/MocA family oxidoreductase [Herbiconiux aconitum]MCS5720130.1 Gfo/Idh/MocA family oxidoreductase [Herbiconiux aconitum]
MSRSLRAAVVGYGTGGRVFHAPLIAADSAYELRMIATGDRERAADAAARYGGGVVVAGADAVLVRASELDLVVVTSPNETHAPLAHRALEAGLDVVVDKPFALSSAEGRAVIEHAEAVGRRVTVFQNRRWDGDFLTVERLIRQGDDGPLGEVRQFESAFEWWKPELSTKWKETAAAERGGGILFDLGPHLIDQAIRLFGPVDEVHAELDRRRPGAVTDDDSFLSLRHANGVRSRLWFSAVSPWNRPRFRVVGSHAVFETEGLDPQESQLKAGVPVNDPAFGHGHPDGLLRSPESTSAVTVAPGAYPEFYRLLAQALTTGAPLPVDPRDSLTVLDIIERAHAS